MNPLSTAKNLISFTKSQLPVFQSKTTKQESIAFTIGDAVPVLNGNELSDYMESWFNGRWYEPQVSMNGLAKSFKCTPYLTTGIVFKINFLANLFIPHSRLKRSAFEQVALDFV